MALPEKIQKRLDAIHKPRPHDKNSLDVLSQCGVISTVKAIMVDFGLKPRSHSFYEDYPLWHDFLCGFFLGDQAYSMLGSPWMDSVESNPDGYIWYQTMQASLDYTGELYTLILKQDNAVEIINGLLAEVGKHRGCKKHRVLESIYQLDEAGCMTLPAECNPRRNA